MESFITIVALVGLVVILASLLSGVLERTGIPLVAVLLLLGATLGPSGLHLVDIVLASPALKTLATLALTLVLFSDAVIIDTRQIRARRGLALTLLGPGTLVPAAFIAVAAWLLLDVSVPAAAILGAALASTDPVLLRTALRSRQLGADPRMALRLESGMNDVVLLPIVVLSMLALQHEASATAVPMQEIGRHAIGLFILGPALGALIGWLGIIILARVRDSVGVRRDYESLYALGLAFFAYAAAESVGGSGFLAAFAAGFMVAAQDVELCDCFLEYGEATAEMLLLLTFVALGTSLIWAGFGTISVRTLAFAAVALGIRTVVLLPMLKATALSRRDRLVIALFGPRGLSSLLFVLLPVFAGIPGSIALFNVTCLVVLLSVVIHGGGMGWFLRWCAAEEADGSSAGGPPVQDEGAIAMVRPQGLPVLQDQIPEKITIAEAKALRTRNPDDVVIIDARADRHYSRGGLKAKGAVRVSVEDPVHDAHAQRLSKRATLVVYCA